MLVDFFLLPETALSAASFMHTSPALRPVALAAADPSPAAAVLLASSRALSILALAMRCLLSIFSVSLACISSSAFRALCPKGRSLPAISPLIEPLLDLLLAPPAATGPATRFMPPVLQTIPNEVGGMTLGAPPSASRVSRCAYAPGQAVTCGSLPQSSMTHSRKRLAEVPRSSGERRWLESSALDAVGSLRTQEHTMMYLNVESKSAPLLTQQDRNCAVGPVPHAWGHLGTLQARHRS